MNIWYELVIEMKGTERRAKNAKLRLAMPVENVKAAISYVNYSAERRKGKKMILLIQTDPSVSGFCVFIFCRVKLLPKKFSLFILLLWAAVWENETEKNVLLLC